MNIKENSFDVAIVGGTPGGIMSAIQAARMGSSVALIEYHYHLGGMSASGLGKSDIENKEAVSGIFREFTYHVHQYYIEKYGLGSENEKLSRNGYYYEPSVAEEVFDKMIANEVGITCFLGFQAEGAITKEDEIKEACFKNQRENSVLKVKATVFIDATYEGDLYALAGSAYRLGRDETRVNLTNSMLGKYFSIIMIAGYCLEVQGKVTIIFLHSHIVCV